MPALYLNVAKESTAYNGAEVVIKDNYCENASHQEVKRKYTHPDDQRHRRPPRRPGPPLEPVHGLRFAA